MAYSNKKFIEPSVSDEIIAFLFSGRSTHLYKKILWERIQKKRNVSYHNFYQNIYRLQKKGLVEPGDLLTLSKKGKLWAVNPRWLIRAQPGKDKKFLIIFDIPETKKKTRDWLRFQIRFWDFEMIQKSVWMGNGPLPPEFQERLKILGIDKNVKLFRVRKINP